jgi:hypothetical protein
MTVKELAIQVPNQPVQLAKISELMREAGINILALFVSTDTASGQGLLRLVVDNPEKAANVLTSQGMKVELAEVVAVEISHHAGGLLAVLTSLKRAVVNVEYLYSCIHTGQVTILILGVGKQLREALDALKKDWIRLYGEELYNM